MEGPWECHSLATDMAQGTGKRSRSLRGLTHHAISVTDVMQEQLHLGCVCHILFPRPFPASATALTAMCEAAPLGIEICPHKGYRHDSERMAVPGLGELFG